MLPVKSAYRLLIILVSALFYTASAQQYTFKCGTTQYICGKQVTEQTMCVSGTAIKSVVTGSTKDCQAMQKAMKQYQMSIFTTNKWKCPNGQFMENWVVYNSLGKNGKKCEKQGCAKCKGAHCGGDPHFLTYDGTGYTYHGQCDLVMARSDSINDSGLSLDIHARTTIIADWSYISNAAVRIGTDILEVTSKGEHFLNGIPGEPFPFLMGGRYTVNQTLKEVFPGLYRTDFLIDLEYLGDENDDDSDVIRISAFKDLLSVTVDATLPDTYGMLGVRGKPGLVGRDLETTIEDPNQMGPAWQVRDNEPKLFLEANRAPQYPSQCMLPAKTERRLGLSRLDKEIRQIAKSACSKINDSTMRQFCKHDVMLTGDAQISLMYSED